MTRLTMLFIAVALVLPGAALAMPTNDVSGAQPQATQDLRAPDRDPGTVAALGTPRDEHGVDQAAQEPVATDGDGLSWTLAIGAGIALMLGALGLGVYAGRTIHPRHIGA
jgi:hypothetical protein